MSRFMAYTIILFLYVLTMKYIIPIIWWFHGIDRVFSRLNEISMTSPLYSINLILHTLIIITITIIYADVE